MNVIPMQQPDGIKPATLQDENGVKGTVAAPTGNSDTGYQLASPQPLVPPPPTSNTDSPSLSSDSLVKSGISPVNSSSMAPPSSVNTNPQLPTAPMAMPGLQTVDAPINYSSAPAGARPITGNETPYTIDPSNSQGTTDLLAKLTGQAMGGSAQSALSGRLESEAMRQLDQPTVYDDALFKSAADMMKRGVNSNYDLADTQLAGELADRGINYSTIAGGNIMDLKRSRANALSDVDTNLLRERALALAQGRSAAFANARGVSGDEYGRSVDDRNFARGILGDRASLEAGQRNEQRGERGYVDSLARDARDEALQLGQIDQNYSDQNYNDYGNLLAKIYGYGTDTSGSQLLDRAGGTYGDAANTFGRDAAGNEDDLGDLARYATQYLYPQKNSNGEAVR